MKLILKTFTLLGLSLLFVGKVSAQENTILDGAYIREHTPTRRVTPYPPLREADVMWSKRVWRLIDLREKINHPLYFPTEDINDRKSLFQVIKHALLVDGSITAYDPGPLLDDDEFKVPLLPSEVKAMFSTVDTVPVEDLDTGEITEEYVPIELESGDIKQFKVKEEWYFDRKRSVMDVRIIGIAPMKEMKDPNTGEIRGYAEMFWVYFPECRYVFANWECFNRQNDSERLSYDDVFHKRMFNSVIIKEANVYDRSISQYTKGINQLYEAETIKQKLFEFEHDLWEY